jgi:hypothetical protein
MGRKKINSTKVDEFGVVIKANITEWKEANPGALVFDSKQEWGCWMRLKASGFKLVLKPEPLELIPTQRRRVMMHDPDVARRLRIDRRDSVCKADKTMYKRLANKNNQKKLYKKTIEKVTWGPDFFLPEFNMYVEYKGHPNEAFPIKLKLAQNSFDGVEFVVVTTLKETEDLILFLKNGNKN